MRITILTGVFPPDIGGPAIYTQKLTEELVKRGVGVAIITYADSGVLKSQIPNSKFQAHCSHTANSKFQIVKISKKYPKGLRHLLYLWQVLRLAKDSDVLYAQNLFSVGIPGLIVSKILRKKVVVKIVGNYAWEQSITRGWFKGGIEEFRKSDGLRAQFLKKIQGMLAKQASLVIVPCQYLKKIVKEWGVPEEKLRVIYNAPEDLPILNITKQEAQEEIGLEGNIILSIGRLDPWKGFSCLIEVVDELIKEGQNLKLLIIGEGTEKKNLESQIKNLGLESNIKLIGKVIHQNLSLYFKAADIFILNSAQEGFSHVILEAMQQGVPIITTSVGGNPELIESGFNGILVEYNNKQQIKETIVKILNDKNLQAKFINNSKLKIQNFTWKKLVEELSEVLKS